ncbi:probable G-protein coupled receptor 141 [Pelobates fuscus]|uniref:probable G-protein coupled receptor 141 n=1 Tax=Pelobates fuscus TaxID=191477 RepID=UPI002FE4D047
MSDNSTQNETDCLLADNTANGILLAIYSVVFLGGFIGTLIMIFLICRTNTRSVTITAVINLVVAHTVFLLTVPFRIAYIIQKKWIFTTIFCRLVSAMIHIHMYICFVFYLIMLGTRFVIFFQHKDKIEFYRILHSVATSAAVWIVILIIALPTFLVYGQNSIPNLPDRCFYFHKELSSNIVIIMNYIIIAIMISVVCLLLTIQILIIVKVVKKIQGSVLVHQEFWAQLKSLFFILVMLFCFLPFHLFRIYYLKHTDSCSTYNEISLAVTALSCLDLSIFAIHTYFHKVCQRNMCKCLI